MTGDDLGAWLKAAAENKITTKNTWRATLIDHFSDVNKFKETQGINFQKASCTLDGCVKVYSTRVDDVSENALRLLEGFVEEEGGKRKQGKKKGKRTLERAVANLNIKTRTARSFLDPRFLYLGSLPENSLLLATIPISPDGVYRMYSTPCETEIVMESAGICLDFPRPVLITPGISECKEAEQIVMEPVAEDAMEDVDDVGGFDESFGFDEVSPVGESQRAVFRETPFTYFRGWAGPSHWKIGVRRTAGPAPRPREKEKFFLDFTEPVGHEGIAELGNTLFDQAFIQKRRETKYVLPHDFRLEIGDLYRYLVRDSSFNVAQDDCMDLNAAAMDSPANGLIENELADEFTAEPADEFTTDLAPLQAQHKNPLPFRKAPKKVDIKRLKENIYSRVAEAKSTDLASIVREIPSIYSEKEARDISVHLCLISLLHLANERDIELANTGSNVDVRIGSK
jgi:condensin complex subunit 2